MSYCVECEEIGCPVEGMTMGCEKGGCYDVFCLGHKARHDKRVHQIAWIVHVPIENYGSSYCGNCNHELGDLTKRPTPQECPNCSFTLKGYKTDNFGGSDL